MNNYEDIAKYYWYKTLKRIEDGFKVYYYKGTRYIHNQTKIEQTVIDSYNLEFIGFGDINFIKNMKGDK